MFKFETIEFVVLVLELVLILWFESNLNQWVDSFLLDEDAEEEEYVSDCKDE